MPATFKNGIYVAEHKNTRKFQIEKMPPPNKVSIPMAQHIGVPCTPLVKIGDIVDKGQKIGDVPPDALGCPVHASVSGKIIGITDVFMPNAVKIKNVIIENDNEDRLSNDVKAFDKKLTEASFDEIVNIVREAGISGMGGATFPTYMKIKSAAGKVDKLFINCAECEPYITVNHRLLLENPAAVINGMKIILKALGLRSGIIAIEDNKYDAINKLEELTSVNDLIKISILKTKYPQGDESQIVYALTGKEIPAGKLPIDAGCVIFNPETCANIFFAFAKGTPLIERIVTVDGDCVKNPKNLLVPIGTSYKDIIGFCGGLKREPVKIINGGPMMGIAQWDINTTITKGTSAILVFSKKYTNEFKQPAACIRCGKCIGSCPKRLMPVYLANFAQAGKLDMCEKYSVLNCVECGACSYVCPGNVPIVQYIRVAKTKITEDRKAKQIALAASSKEVKTDGKSPN